MALPLAACSGSSAATAPLAPTELHLVATDITFDAGELHVPVGQPVRLALENQGALVHDFSIATIPLAGAPVVATSGSDAHSGHAAADQTALQDHDAAMGEMANAPAVHLSLAPGASGTVEFTPAQPGTYAFVCTEAGHEAAGMTGTLVVTQ